jgi:hypothetical protein
MTTPPTLIPNPNPADQDHLNLLSIFHFVNAGLSLMGGAFFVLFFVMTGAMIHNAPHSSGPQNQPPPELIPIIGLMILFMAALVLASAIVNLLSGIFIRKRKHHVFSLIVAGFNCLHFPLGTALGVFTFVVLLRDSVQRLYREAAIP